MACKPTMTVRLRGALGEVKEPTAQEAFDGLIAEVAHAFAAPESTYHPLSATEVIARNRP